MTDFNVCRFSLSWIPTLNATTHTLAEGQDPQQTPYSRLYVLQLCGSKARPSKNELEVINKRPNFGRSMFFLCYSFSTSHFLIQFLFELYMFVAFHLLHIWLPSASFSVVIFVKSTSLTTISVLSS